MEPRIIISGAALLLTFAASVKAAEPAAALPEGRSVAQDCEPGVEVCAVMTPDRLVSYTDRCAARSAGAQRILEGPCFDAD